MEGGGKGGLGAAGDVVINGENSTKMKMRTREEGGGKEEGERGGRRKMEGEGVVVGGGQEGGAACDDGMEEAVRKVRVIRIVFGLKSTPFPLCCVVSCCAVFCYVVLCCVVFCYVVLCCVVSCRVVSCCVVFCYVVLCCVVLCRVVLCCVVLCCAVLPFPSPPITFLGVFFLFNSIQLSPCLGVAHFSVSYHSTVPSTVLGCGLFPSTRESTNPKPRTRSPYP